MPIILRLRVPSFRRSRLKLSPSHAEAGSGLPPGVECLPEPLFEAYAIGRLQGAELSRFERHCAGCAHCRERRNASEACLYSLQRALATPAPISEFHPFSLDSPGSPMASRLLAGAAAVVLLAGIFQVTPSFRSQPQFQFSLLPAPVSGDGGIDVAAAAEEPAVIESQAPPARTEARPHVAQATFAAARLMGPRRPFVMPSRPIQRRRLETALTLDPPSSITPAAIDFPRVPAQLPSLRPPERHGVKRFFFAVGVPFKHLGSLIAGNEKI